ncbi:uncharacterized protein LOC142418522 isoform X2 [Mycteria americana]|uniref:uncharacterized protein LOC142418522 isoform X2 n=1 Tax=Mycteria americana TaxID=33587 RepID=UPI003F5840BA
MAGACAMPGSSMVADEGRGCRGGERTPSAGAGLSPGCPGVAGWAASKLPAPPLKPVHSPGPPPSPVKKAASWPLNALDCPLMWVLLAAVRGKSGVSRSPCGRRGFSQGWSALITVAAASFPLPEAVLRLCLSVPPLGLPVPAPASALRGLSVPGLALLAAWGRKGTGRALAGCGQELLRLKLERPDKGGGQPSNQSYRRGREEGRRKKCLNWQILPAAPRARAVLWTPSEHVFITRKCHWATDRLHFTL